MNIAFVAILVALSSQVFANDPARRMVQGAQNLRQYISTSDMIRLNERIINVQNPNLYRMMQEGDRVTIEYRNKPEAARRLYRQDLVRQHRALMSQIEDWQEMARSDNSPRLRAQLNRTIVEAGGIATRIQGLDEGRVLVPQRVYRTEITFVSPRQLEVEIELLGGHGRPYIIHQFRRLPAKAVRLLRSARNGMVAVSSVVAMGLISTEAAAQSRIRANRDRELRELEGN